MLAQALKGDATCGEDLRSTQMKVGQRGRHTRSFSGSRRPFSSNHVFHAGIRGSANNASLMKEDCRV